MEDLKRDLTESLRTTSWRRYYIYSYLADKEWGVWKNCVEMRELAFEPRVPSSRANFSDPLASLGVCEMFVEWIIKHINEQMSNEGKNHTNTEKLSTPLTKARHFLASKQRS